MAGIDNLLESLDDLERAILGSLKLARGGLGLGSIPALLEAVRDLIDLAADLHKALPEVSDIDAAESGILSQRCYLLVKRIIAGVK